MSIIHTHYEFLRDAIFEMIKFLKTKNYYSYEYIILDYDTGFYILLH